MLREYDQLFLLLNPVWLILMAQVGLKLPFQLGRQFARQ